ncbi:hypothetical protein [Halalkalicoccus ordinarius]|uniref:hypothetical protein n=1 Tax=Halalkalicoccus ordinarius TaxID=3116651 RepID=UPI00300F4B70
MVTIGQVVLSVATVLLSVLLSGFLSWRISKGKLQMKYEWERYSDAEEWCDEFIRLIRELQANYEYKYRVLDSNIQNSGGWIPGNDLDEYGSRVMKHLANRPPLIFNLIGKRDEGEVGISDNAGAISLYCGILADENLRSMDDEVSETMAELKDDLYNPCEDLINEVMELRNEDLQADFKE